MKVFKVIGIIVVIVTMLAMASTAAAHNLKITNPQNGEVVTEQWAGGFTVPAEADPMFGPYNLPPSHDRGLVKACHGTGSSPAATFVAPPYGSCEHGVPPAP
jgi:hypothetical protein